MIRILVYVVLIFAAAAGFAWLADHPGEVVLRFQSYEIRTTAMIAAIALLILLFLLWVLWTLLRAVLRAPRNWSRRAAENHRDKGHRALSRGLVAIGSGDAQLARHYAAEARAHVRGDPLALLLTAQAAQLAGDEAGARAAYEAMLNNPETRVLGLRGLYIEAQRRQDAVAAQSFASEAAREKPGLAWAGLAMLDFQAAAGDWASALDTLTSLGLTGSLPTSKANRLRAVLLTARAIDIEDAEPQAALTAAAEAHRLAPELVPAAVIAARLQTRFGDVKRATKTIEATWRIEPHPDLAAAYMDIRPGEAGRERLRRVRALTRIRTNHVEGQLAIARAAIDAKDWAAAREELKGVVATQPTERAFLMMAEIEEGEHNDIGRARDWLNRAVRAPADPAWIADGQAFDHWEPVSPVSGRLDAFEWKASQERLAPPVAPSAATGTALITAADAVLEAEAVAAMVAPAIAAPVRAAAPTPPPAAAPAPTPAPPPAPAAPGPVIAAMPAAPVTEPAVAAAPAPPATTAPADIADAGLPRQPDDPGPEPPSTEPANGKAAAGRRFRLF